MKPGQGRPEDVYYDAWKQLENVAVWSFLQPGAYQKPDIPSLKQAVYTLLLTAAQKTGDMKKGRPQDIRWENQEHTKFCVLCGATALVLSDKLDALETELEALEALEDQLEIEREIKAAEDDAGSGGI